MEDIRETGTEGLRYGLGTLDNNRPEELSFEQAMANMNRFKGASAKQLSEVFKPSYSEPVGYLLANAGYGKSTYDKYAVSDLDFANLNDIRAAHLPGILQLGNGILKMGTTGITTFLNSTVGTLYGIGTGIGNVTGLNGTNEDGTNKSFILGMWQNDFNEITSGILDAMEEVLPNYYSNEEINSPWYTNILSANFWGDKVLKNMGFTIGALGAMAFTGGTGIAGITGKTIQGLTNFTLGNAGKMLSASKGTLAGINSFARGAGQIAHNFVLSSIGASGEASIEAINAVKEAGKDIYSNLDRRREELIQQLDPYAPDYYENLAAIDAATNTYKKQIDSKLRDAGNSVYGLNMAILSLSNLLEFAPLIKGGFLRSAKLADFELRLGERTVGMQEWAQGLLRGERATIANTMNNSWKKTAATALKNAAVESWEESAQNLASNTEQYYAKARLNQSAGTLFGNRINPEVTTELTDYTKAFLKAMYDNFGSAESRGWEEAFLGALTGGVGFIGLRPYGVKNEKGELMYDPITHLKVTTWKPKSISDWFQGGIMEARRSTLEAYEENQLIVDAVNQKLADPDFIKRFQYAVGSKNFANQMEEALKENNMFKFKNSEIGKLVNDIFFFRDKGMIDEYKAMWKSFTNIDDKTLQQLYAATSDDLGDTPLAQEDLEKVRTEYLDKAKRTLEKINMILDYYDYVDLEYRDRSPMFKEELAYQYIRLDDTKRRIKELEDKKTRPNKLKATVLGLIDASKVLEYDDGSPSALRLNYENSIVSGLTKLEEADLERLKRQEKQYLDRIDRTKKDPKTVDLEINLDYLKAKADAESKDVEGLVSKLKEANTVADINRIITSADDSIKLEILNRVYLEEDTELKEKIQLQIAASTAYNKTVLRLEKAGWNPEKARATAESMKELLFAVYMTNNMDLNEVRKTLLKIQLELNEDSIDTISKLIPDTYNTFESFLGESNKKEKGIFQDVLEGALEDIESGILSSERWKVGQLIKAKAAKQKTVSEQKKQLNEETKKKKALSFDAAVKASTYVKQISGLESHLKAFEDFGVEELDTAIKDALESSDETDNPKAVSLLLKIAKAVVANGNPQLKVKELLKKIKKGNVAADLLDYFDEKYNSTSSTQTKKPAKNAFKELMDLLKDADKKEDTNAVLSIISKVSSDMLYYTSLGAKDSDFEYMAKLELKYKNKKKAIKKDSETHIKEEKKKKDKKEEDKLDEDKKPGKKFEDNTTEEEKQEEDTEEEEDENFEMDIEESGIIGSEEIQPLLTKLFESLHLDPSTLSLLERQEIVSNLEKARELISKKQNIPEKLIPYAEVIIKEEREEPVIIKTPEAPSTEAVDSNELNGAYLGLYDVGNRGEGRPNKLLEMEATIPDNTNSLDYFYDGVEHAEQVLWCIDNILKDLKKTNTPVSILIDTSKPNVLYPAIKATDKLKAKIKNRWIVPTNKGEYIIIGVLGFNNNSDSLKAYWKSISDNILLQVPNGTLGYWVSTDEKHVLKINNIGDGRPAKSHYKHTSTSSIVELVEGTDTGRNPQGLTLKTLKWQIIYGDEPRSVHVASGDKIRGNANQVAGKVYLLIPTPSGAYYRHPVNPITIDEINKDSRIYKRIDKLLENIIRNKKTVDVISLKNELVLDSDAQDISYLSIYFEPNGIKVKYIPRGSEGDTESIMLSLDTEEAIEQLKDIVYNRIRPFISVTLARLESQKAIKDLDEAGALQLKGSLGMLSYVGANYTLIPYNETVNSKTNNRLKSSLEALDLEIRYNGQLIFKKGNDYLRNGVIITDASELEILKDIEAINDGLYTGENLWQWKTKGKGKSRKQYLEFLEGLYFFIQKGNSVIVYHIDGRGNITQVPKERAKELISIREENEKYRIADEREAAQEAGVGIEGEDMDIFGEEDYNISIPELKTLGNTILDKAGYTTTDRHSNGHIRGGQHGWKLRFIVKNPKTGKTFTQEEYDTDRDAYFEAAKPILSYLQEYFKNPDGSDTISQVKPTNALEAHYQYKNKEGEVREPFKFLSGGEVGESDFTIYIGSMDDVNKFIADVQNSQIYNLLATGNNNGSDTVFNERVHGRIEGKKLGFSGYGLPEGIQKMIPENTIVYENDVIRIITSLDSYEILDKETNILYNYSLLSDRDIDKYVQAHILEIRNAIASNLYGAYINGTGETNDSIKKITTAKEDSDNINIELRKQAAVKRAIYDLEQQKEIKIGDTITLPSDTLPDNQIVITGIEFSEVHTLLYGDTKDKYGYSDIAGTVVITYLDDGLEHTIPVSTILALNKYKKINKQSQKPLNDLDNSNNNSTFVARLMDSNLNTSDIRMLLINKAKNIAAKKGLTFEVRNMNLLIEWYKQNVMDLNAIPSNADAKMVEKLIDNCK